jgi:hypothetical protein
MSAVVIFSSGEICHKQQTAVKTTSQRKAAHGPLDTRAGINFRAARSGIPRAMALRTNAVAHKGTGSKLSFTESIIFPC